MTKSLETQKEYKLQQKIKKEEEKRKKMIEKHNKSLEQKRIEAIEKAKANINTIYEKKLASYKKQQQRQLEKNKRKILGKKPLKKHTKSKTYSNYFQELLVTIQLYVRLRDSNIMGYGKCISCGKLVHYKKANGGHYMSRGKKSTAYLEDNIHLQCTTCNKPSSQGGLNGNLIDYRKNLIKKIGEKRVEELELMSKKLDKPDLNRVKDLIIYYKGLNKMMEQTKKGK